MDFRQVSWEVFVFVIFRMSVKEIRFIPNNTCNQRTALVYLYKAWFLPSTIELLYCRINKLNKNHPFSWDVSRIPQIHSFGSFHLFVSSFHFLSISSILHVVELCSTENFKVPNTLKVQWVHYFCHLMWYDVYNFVTFTEEIGVCFAYLWCSSAHRSVQENNERIRFLCLLLIWWTTVQ